MSWVSEVTADSPSLWARLAETSGTSAADVQGATGTYVGGFTLNQPSLLNAAAGDRAVALDARTGYIRFPDSAALDRGDVFTLEAWVNPTTYRDSANLGGTIIDKGSGAYIMRFANALDGRILFRRNSVADIVVSTRAVPLNTVTHVVVTKNGSTVRMYFNGVDVTGTVTNSTMVNNAIALGIGAADAGTDNFFGGTIDEAVIYSTALSSTRVLAHYNAGVQVFGTAAVTAGAQTTGSGTKGGKGSASSTAGGASTSTGQKGGRGGITVSAGGSVSSSATKGGRGSATCSGGASMSSTGRKAGFGSANVTAGAAVNATGHRGLHVSPPTHALIVPVELGSVVQDHPTTASIDPATSSADIDPATSTLTISARSSSASVTGRSMSVALRSRTTSAVIHA